MFEIDITMKDINNEYPEKKIIMTGHLLESLKGEMNDMIFDSLSESGSYYVEISILEDGEYFDTDEFVGFFDLETRTVAQSILDQTQETVLLCNEPCKITQTEKSSASGKLQTTNTTGDNNRFVHPVAV